MTEKKRFASVWDAIEDTPQEAASMRARSALMMSLTEAIRTQEMTQAQAAALFGVTQPRISDLMRGKVNLFSLDTLIDMAATAGMMPTVKVSMPKAAHQTESKSATLAASSTAKSSTHRVGTAKRPTRRATSPA